MGLIEQPSGIRPLTHTGSEGVYRRTTEVEREIASALALDPSHILQRAQQRDYTHPEYLSPECLVHLIREFHMRGDEEIVSALCGSLLQYSAKRINGHLNALDPESVDESFREVITALFSLILDLKSDAGDFLQVRYWIVVDRLTITAFQKRVRLLEQEDNTVSLSSLPGEEESQDSEDDRTPSVKRITWFDNAVSAEDRVLIAEALGRLRELVRRAFFLVHAEGLPIESKDPTIMTVSRALGKSGRMIQNSLAEAEKVLREWRGEQS